MLACMDIVLLADHNYSIYESEMHKIHTNEKVYK